MATTQPSGASASPLWPVGARMWSVVRMQGIRQAACWLGVTGLAVALALATTIVILRPAGPRVAQLAINLALAGAAAFVLGQVATRAAGATRIASVRARLAIPPLLTALVIALTVIALAQAMFISPEDSVLVLVFLGFALLVALALAVFLADGIARSITRVETGARRVAEGNYAFRVPDLDSAGSDELARLARWFNAMAANVEEAFARRDRAEADRRQMLAALSHDLRTPLTSIRAMIESIDDGVTTDEETVRRYQRAIRAEVRRLGTLLNELFELSRLESGALLLARERLGIEDLVSEALEAFHEQAERHEVLLRGRVAADLPLVSIDARQIARVLGNLVQNALRYTPAGGAILVCAERTREARDASVLLVWVADSGPGIGAADLARIFEPTYQCDPSRTRAPQSPEQPTGASGAGLGLAIARGIVELHGGRIWAQSPLPPDLRAGVRSMMANANAHAEPPGTAVCFTLPLAPS